MNLIGAARLEFAVRNHGNLSSESAGYGNFVDS